jgi:hypothetical protein
MQPTSQLEQEARLATELDDLIEGATQRGGVHGKEQRVRGNPGDRGDGDYPTR